MPLVEITMIEGRTQEQIRAVLREVHDAVVHVLDADPAGVRVVVREVPPTHWSAGGQTIAERRSPSG